MYVYIYMYICVYIYIADATGNTFFIFKSAISGSFQKKKIERFNILSHSKSEMTSIIPRFVCMVPRFVCMIPLCVQHLYHSTFFSVLQFTMFPSSKIASVYLSTYTYLHMHLLISQPIYTCIQVIYIYVHTYASHDLYTYIRMHLLISQPAYTHFSIISSRYLLSNLRIDVLRGKHLGCYYYHHSFNFKP